MTITTKQAESQQPISTESTSIIRSFQRIVPEYNLINQGDISLPQTTHPAKPSTNQIQNMSAVFNNPATDLTSAQDILCESATQTLEVTNLNVISNIKLSQPTLDLIFSHVMSDLQTKLPKIVNPKPKNTNVVYETSYKQNIPSPTAKELRHLPQTEAQIKTADRRQIEEGRPEASNLDLRLGKKSSKSSKMFVSMCPVLVKTSSADGGSDNEKDSDDSSLVDSLEDSIYSESDVQKGGTNWKKRNKPTTFFIPIEVSEGTELKSVSEHLPERVRDRLIRRHQLRQQRQLKRRSRQRASINEYSYGRRVTLRMKREVDRTPKLPELNESKVSSRSVLHNADTSRKGKGHKEAVSVHKSNIGPSKSSSTRQTCYFVRERDKDRLPRMLSPINRSKNKLVNDTQKVSDKTESSRRIEILNIMEYSSPVQETSLQHLQGNSRIPVLIGHRSPSLQINIRTPRQQIMKANNNTSPDSKIDQLIANILINTQVNKTRPPVATNFPHSVRNMSSSLSNKRRHSCQSWDFKYDHMMEPVREQMLRFEDEIIKTHKQFNESNPTPRKVTETSHHCLRYDGSDGEDNDESENAKKLSSWNTYKGKAAIDVIGDENFLAIPKGWITFYMLHESTGSPCSNSDEGKQDPLSESETSKLKPHGISNTPMSDRQRPLKTKLGVNKPRGHRVKSSERSTNIGVNVSSNNSAVEYKTILPSLYGEDSSKRSYEHRKIRQATPRKDSAYKQSNQNKWQITVSGQHNSAKYPSDLEMHLRVSEYFNRKDYEKALTDGLAEECVCEPERIYFPRIDGKLRDEISAIHKRLEREGQKPSEKQLPHISKVKHFGYKMA